MRAILMASAVVIAAGIGGWTSSDRSSSDDAGLALLANPQVCGRVGSALSGASVIDMVMVDGFGTGGFPVDTANPEAQAWFDHGVRLRWAFEHAESVRAFRKARLLDPTCGVCAWGEAWALGPNLNGGGNDAASQDAARRAALEARTLARDASPLQRRMIDALIQRYSGREATRSARFARAMESLAQRNPRDVALKAIAADALMLQASAWWDDDGKPADPAIPRALALLEQALRQAPDDPAAIHLYIHLTEWSDDPHAAIPYGERLARLAPGASHLVHMPSHTFFRVGRYREAMGSNVQAVALDRRYADLADPPGGVPGMPLHGHNIHFGMGGALMSGGATDGLALADAFLKTYPDIPASNVWRQFVANNAYAVYGRFADEARMANLAEPGADNPLLRISWHYARGEAAARRGVASAVRAEANAIKALREAMTFDGPMAVEQSGFTEISQRVLEGRAAMLEDNPAAAVIAYGRAAQIQGMAQEGGDPPIVWFPTRRSLAAALLATGDASAAEAKVQELLIDWPRDPYSLYVLAEARTALGDTAGAAEARGRASQEWIGGTMSLPLA